MTACSRQQTEAKINVRAWRDEAFRALLLRDPHAALKQMGMTRVPACLDVQTAQESKNQWLIRLQAPPFNAHELSDEVLEGIAAGMPQEPKCCPKQN